MTSNQLAGVAGVLLSLLFSYAPGFSTWYDKQDTVTKSLVMLVLIVAAGIGALVYSCQTAVPAAVLQECLKMNWVTYATAIGYALVANQGTYLISPSKQAIATVAAAKITAAAAPPAETPAPKP